MSSMSVLGAGVGVVGAAGGTLRYLTCSTHRAARTPLRRRMPAGQRRAGVASPAPLELILRSHAFTTMRARASEQARTSRKIQRSRLRAASDWSDCGRTEAREPPRAARRRHPRGRAVTSRARTIAPELAPTSNAIVCTYCYLSL